MSDYIEKLSRMKRDIGVIQDSLFFEMHNLEEEITKLQAVILDLSEALAVAANQLEGAALGIEVHGKNMNFQFFIDTLKSSADQKRETLSKHQAIIGQLRQARKNE